MLRRWWDAPLGNSGVTALHKALRRHRGSGSEVMSVESRRSCLRTWRMRAVEYLNNVQCICPSSHPGTLKEALHPRIQSGCCIQNIWKTRREENNNSSWLNLLSLKIFCSRKCHLLTYSCAPVSSLFRPHPQFLTVQWMEFLSVGF